MKVSINSDGTLLEETLVRELKKIKLSGFEIDISLDGHNSITNDLFRGEGTFKKITKNIKYLDKYGINFNVAWIVNKKNINYISEMAKLSQKIGAKALLISDLLPMGRAKNMSDILLSKNDIKKLIQQAYELYKEYHPSLSIRVGSPFAFLVDPKNITNEIRKERKQWRFKQYCGMGFTRLFIAPSGAITPCVFIHRKLGNIFDNNLEELWNSKEMDELRHIVKNPKGKCSICEYKDICCGCRAVALHRTGNIYNEDPRCWYLKGNKTLN